MTDPKAAASVEPVMFGIRSTRDGSFTDRVAVCGWSSFDERMNGLKKEPWTQTGMAEIVPLYTHPDERVALLEELLIDAEQGIRVLKTMLKIEHLPGGAAAAEKLIERIRAALGEG
jgi:hypothetical protein